MSESEKTLDKQLQLLFRAIRQPDEFRFIVLPYNRYPAIEKTLSALREQYPERSILEIRIEQEDYYSLIEKITSHKGIIAIRDFDRLLENPEIYRGFNQRRDKIAQQPVQILAFLRDNPENLQQCAENIRDWWSVRNLVLHLRVDWSQEKPSEQDRIHLWLHSPPEIDQPAARKEAKRLKKRITELEATHEADDLLMILYPQAVQLLENLEEYDEAIELAEKWLYRTGQTGGDKKSRAHIYGIMCDLFAFAGLIAEAFKCGKMALRLVLESGDEESAIYYRNMVAQFYLDLFDPPKGWQLLLENLEWCEKKYGQEDLRTIECYLSIGYVLSMGKAYEKAQEIFEWIADFFQRQPDHPEAETYLSIAYTELAGILERKGDYSGAIALVEKVIEMDKDKDKVPDHMASLFQKAAGLYAKMGEKDKAILFYDKALEIYRKMRRKLPFYTIFIPFLRRDRDQLKAEVKREKKSSASRRKRGSIASNASRF